MAEKKKGGKALKIILIVVASLTILSVIYYLIPQDVRDKLSKEENSAQNSSTVSVISKSESSKSDVSKNESSKKESSAASSKNESSKESSILQLKTYNFIVNTKSGLYHKESCSAAAKISDEHKKVITIEAYTMKEAVEKVEAQGYQQCKKCF